MIIAKPINFQATDPIKTNQNHYDAIIIGGGASGLMCAATAGQRGRRVLVLDSSNKVGKKILMSGGGRCNFTNLHLDARKHFISANPHFCLSALKRYTAWHFIELVQRYQIPYEERKHGQLFCLNSAKDILNMLLAECAATGITPQTHCTVDKIVYADEEKIFTLSTNQGIYTATSLVIATGGLSIPTMGATGFGYTVARQFGHTVLPTRAGLVPFTFSDSEQGFKGLSERLSGLAVDMTVATLCNQNENKNVHSFNEAVLFTHRGLSGPATLQISNYWNLGENISLDLFPQHSLNDFVAWLKNLKLSHGKLLLRTVLAEYLPKNLVLELQQALWQADAETTIANIPDAHLAKLAHNLKSWVQKPSGTEGYRTAEVTLGGVDTNQISSKTMESHLQKGLFFIGEVLDVTGHLGGFNFQWAWASGVAAGAVV